MLNLVEPDHQDDKAAAWSVYAVTTTGIYCRPDCGARRPLPQNIRFFASTVAARRAGYRACKRCRPDAAPEDVVAAACRRIEAAETAPSLAALSQAAGLSPFHFHRLFKAATGLTPRAYAAAHRAARLRTALTPAASVTQAIYESGYQSSGRFYAEATDNLGMAPAAYKAGAPGEAIIYGIAACALGTILVAASAKGICAIALGDAPDPLIAALRAKFPAACLADDPAFATTIKAVIAFVEASKTRFDLPLDIRGTAFQRRVWQALRDIQAGETASYTEIATRIGAPTSARAVASACAANTLAVLIPCHRAVRADGTLSGYRWGAGRKRALLDREAET
jgi:AraC family transcriptional regulator of adaptative response/methylated-DNA-[protein]-cysteine methyltransferase